MELDGMLDRFERLGIQVVAVSSNPRELAERSVREWELGKLTVGYGLSIDDARRWGLFVSAAIKDTEPAHFSEPGLFVIRADGTLFSSIVQTMPFSRPAAAQILKTLEFIVDKDYPARGEVAPDAYLEG